MEALILSCCTGGGHNAAGRAVKEALERRGHSVVMFDPYILDNDRLGDRIGGIYVGMVRNYGRVFGGIYQAGEIYRHLPVHSPVFLANTKMAERLQAYLKEHPCDVIVMPHIFAAEIITCMKAKGMSLPPTVYIATDYTCIPFTEEIDCDYYLIPSPKLKGEFTHYGVPADKIRAFGLPVSQTFSQSLSRQGAKERLDLPVEKEYILLAGGSFGGGKIPRTVKHLQGYLKEHPKLMLIVICGDHPSLYEKLFRRYKNHPQIMLLRRTECMAEYMRVSKVFITKPGGLSSTEAAASRTLIIHVSPIPGCEVKNARFFAGEGMSLFVRNRKKPLVKALDALQEPENASCMIRAQAEDISSHAAEDICDFLESLVPVEGNQPMSASAWA